MTDRELKQRIKQAFPSPEGEPERKQEFFISLKEQSPVYGAAQTNKSETQLGAYAAVMTRREFYLTQLGYIRKRIWLFSGLLMALAVGMAYSIGHLSLEIGRGRTLLCCVSSIVPILAVLVSVEVNRSFTCGMNELEMSTKHNLLEVYLARGIFLGTGNFLWMFLALLLLMRESEEFLLMLGIYLLVPYLFTMILALEIVRHSRAGNGTMYCVAAACIISAASFLIQRQDRIHIYEDRYRVLWILGFLLLLYLAGKQMVNIKHIWEEQLCS